MAQPNEMWQSDFIHWRLADGTDVELACGVVVAGERKRGAGGQGAVSSRRRQVRITDRAAG
jgi:hypothetical protein